MNLTSVIIQIKEEIRCKEDKHKNEIKCLNDVLAKLRELDTTCKYCNGKGLVLMSEDDIPNPLDPRIFRECMHCCGSGEL